ncbi:hypothetical protein ILYODFUR_033128, partial [Ilyodon furcidens]
LNEAWTSLLVHFSGFRSSLVNMSKSSSSAQQAFVYSVNVFYMGGVLGQRSSGSNNHSDCCRLIRLQILRSLRTSNSPIYVTGTLVQ